MTKKENQLNVDPRYDSAIGGVRKHLYYTVLPFLYFALFGACVFIVYIEYFRFLAKLCSYAFVFD